MWVKVFETSAANKTATKQTAQKSSESGFSRQNYTFIATKPTQTHARSWHNCTYLKVYTTVIKEREFIMGNAINSIITPALTPGSLHPLRISSSESIISRPCLKAAGMNYWKGAWKSIFFVYVCESFMRWRKSQRWEFAYSQQSSQMKIGLCCSAA